MFHISCSYGEKMMDPDYDLFLSVVRAGSLSAAARDLGISAAMVSKRIARLEGRLGAVLLHRTTRRMELTSVGAQLHDDLRHVRDALLAAEQRVRGDDGKASGLLRVSAPTSFGRMHIAPGVTSFLERYPGVRLELDLSDDYVDLRAERLDLAIRIGDPHGTGLVTHVLAPNRRFLCASPAYVDRFGMPATIAALAGHRMLAAMGQLPWRLEGDGGPVQIDGESYVLTNSSEVVREMLLAGGGIALRSAWDVGADMAAGRLIRILPELSGDPRVRIFATHVPAPHVRPAVSAFIAFLADLYDPVPPWEQPG